MWLNMINFVEKKPNKVFKKRRNSTWYICIKYVPNCTCISFVIINLLSVSNTRYLVPFYNEIYEHVFKAILDSKAE